MRKELKMEDRIRFLGIAAFQISTSKGKEILIDPYISKNPVAPCRLEDLKSVDLILVSHAAFDHLGDTEVIAKRFNAPVICGGDVKIHLLEQGVPSSLLIELVWGLTVEVKGIRVRAVESHHRSAIKAKDGSLLTAHPLGFLIDLESGSRIYNSSDTTLFGDMKLIGELYQPDIGLLNVTLPNIEGQPTFLTGEMTPYEAALAAQWLRLRYAIACHYTDPDCEDVKQFVQVLKNATYNNRGAPKPVILRPGEEFRYHHKKEEDGEN